MSEQAAPPDDAIGPELADSIAGLRRALRRGARAADPGNELSVAQVEVLANIAEHDGIRPSQLAAKLRLRPNTITTLVNALEARGLIERQTADDDRRAVVLGATGSGSRVLTAWQATNGAVLNLAVSSLNAAQRRALARAVPALNALASAVARLADSSPAGSASQHTSDSSAAE